MTYRALSLLGAVMLFCSSLFVDITVSAQSSSQGTAMSIADLGLPDGVSDAIPVDINDDGTVVVVGITEQGAAVFLYEGGAFRRIGGEVADGPVHASAVNNDGIVSGWIEREDGTTGALMVGEENLVEMPGGAVSGRALAVNSEGILAGEATIDESIAAASPVYWTDTTVEPLPSAGSGEAGAVNAINTIGHMAGWSAMDAEGVEQHATLWINNEPTDLGTLGGTLSEARAINELGQVVGVSTTAPDQTGYDSEGSSPFLWQDGELANLGLGEGHGWGMANDINDTGLIAGTVSNLSAADPSTATSAAIWTSTALLDLNDISAGEGELHLAEAIAVNNFGQILCRAFDPDGNPHLAVLSVLGN
jgi:probable HAF family extracellular repeat protein